MPTKRAMTAARQDAREGKSPGTQAGHFVEEEMRKKESGTGTAKSRKQAIAIGLSEARRAGVKLGQPKRGSKALKKRAARDSAIGSGRKKVSSKRSRAAKKAARIRARSARR